MLTYADINPAKRAFIFELDNVLYPEKDYLLQVYYLFSNFIEFTETQPPAKDLIRFFKLALENHGTDEIFHRAQKFFDLPPAYEANFLSLQATAILPLQLIMYGPLIKLLQEIVVDRKQIFVITNGNPGVQLNKIRQMQWNGMEKYLTVYFADEMRPKPETDVLELILDKFNLLRRDILIIGNSQADEEFALAGGIDFLPAAAFLS